MQSLKNDPLTLFPTSYDLIVERINAISPIKYAKTRNFINGDVTYLSPYISRGVISVAANQGSCFAKRIQALRN